MPDLRLQIRRLRGWYERFAMADSLGAQSRPRLHAALHGRRPRRGAGARDDRCGRRRGDHRVRHGALLRPRSRGARAQRAVACSCAARVRRGADRPDRDEGRDDARRQRLGAGRPREGDPVRLRGEPRGARRPRDRPLSAARSRSTRAVADSGPRAGPTRRRRARRARGRRERQPRPAGRGARARSARRSAGRRQPVRRPRAAGRGGRALRGEGACGSRALSARRAAPCGRDRPSRGARGGRPCARRERGRGRARLGARPLPLAVADPRRTTSGDGTVRCPRRDARARRGRPRTARGLARPTATQPHAVRVSPGSGRRPRDGHSRRRQEPARRGIRRPRLPQAEPRRARRLAARAGRCARRRPVVGRRAARPGQHVPDARGPQPRPRHRGATRCPGPLRVARHGPRGRAGQPRRAAARATRPAADARRAQAARPARAGDHGPDLPDALPARARASVGRRRLRRGRAKGLRPGSADRARRVGCLRRRQRRSMHPAGRARSRASSRRPRTSCSTGARMDHPTTSRTTWRGLARS